MTVDLLAPPAPLTRQEILDKLTYWRERLHEAQAGTNTPSEPGCREMLDKYLDELNLTDAAEILKRQLA